jgi:hypothetical protein
MTEVEKAKLVADNLFLKRPCAKLEKQLMALNIEIGRLADDPASAIQPTPCHANIEYGALRQITPHPSQPRRQAGGCRGWLGCPLGAVGSN